MIGNHGRKYPDRVRAFLVSMFEKQCGGGNTEPAVGEDFGEIGKVRDRGHIEACEEFRAERFRRGFEK